MKIYIKTSVNQSLSQVWAGFDDSLFKKLAPPFPHVKVIRFDGCKVGDKVEVELNFIFFKQLWISEIVSQTIDLKQIYFIDKGIKLPFFLKNWQHKHLIVQQENHTEIIDDIDFDTPFWLTNYLMYPFMYLQFWYRKAVYQKVFG